MSKSLAQLVPKIARSSLKGSDSKQVLIWQNWDHILGPFAGKVTPHTITKTPGGTLIVHADSNTALHIQYHEPQILERITALAGADQIVRIKVIKTFMAPVSASAVPKATKTAPRAKTLEDALASLEKHLVIKK
ncbi:MAG: DUF721 domain-containing protein [Alphaproteobacteria bacterium]|nr:MAG: DUF721 domain-containing protein [Alphaproteobacteria bacterium]